MTFGGVPGPIAWEYVPTYLLLNPNGLYKFTASILTPDGGTIPVVSDMASASARIPVGSTAIWTADSRDGSNDIHYALTATDLSGFSGISSDTPFNTAMFSGDAGFPAHGSAVLTATGSATIDGADSEFYKVTYGQGDSRFMIALSASGEQFGLFLDPIATAKRTAYVPSNYKTRYSASSQQGYTFSIYSAIVPQMPNFSISWSHRDSGSKMDCVFYPSAAIDLSIAAARTKNVYATGYNHVLPAAQGTASAAAWQPLCIITAFSSNLCTGSSQNTYLTGSANVGSVYGFQSSTSLGALKNSAGTWSNPSSSNTYKWSNRYFLSNSAFFSGTFSAMRTKGPTGSNNATYVFYGRDANNASVSRVSGQFAVPTASAKTATKTASGSFSTTTFGQEAFAIMSNTVAQSTALCANCIGHYTASGQVI